eukprot:1184148-Pyramimonas_sp.AAC.1
MNAERLEQWVQFREEIVSARRAQAAAAAATPRGSMPMELGAFGGKWGGKGGKKGDGHSYPPPPNPVG